MQAQRGSCCPLSSLRVAFQSKRPWEKRAKRPFRERAEGGRGKTTDFEMTDVERVTMRLCASRLCWAPRSSSVRELSGA